MVILSTPRKISMLTGAKNVVAYRGSGKYEKERKVKERKLVLILA